MKSIMQKYAFIAMAMAMMTGDNSCLENRHHQELPEVKLSDEDKERVKREYENQFHTYNVNGEQIKARSKKDAKMIYQRTYKNRR